MKRIAVTGVFQTTDVEWLYEDAIGGEWLNYHEALTQYTEEELQDMDNNNDSDDYLIGFKKTYDKDRSYYWFKPKEGKACGFAPDSKAEYSAIVRGDGNVTQVVRSKWGILGAWASPCYPNQVDADSDGNVLAYSVPVDVVGDINDELKKRIFKL